MQFSASAVAIPRRLSFLSRASMTLGLLAGLQPLAAASNALVDDDPQALDRQPVPRPSNLRDFVKNEQMAIALGKALFWDSQVGGDGLQSCATCHFSGGTDARTLNTMNPGRNGVFEIVPVGSQIPHAGVDIEVDDVIGSQGVVDKSFNNINPGNALDSGTTTANATFLTNRQVTGRNTPTFLNAVFNVENFWDGRAKNTFNGRTPGGKDPSALLLKVGSGGSVTKTTVELRNSSLASQTVGPPNNGVEMSWDGRSFLDLGKKMLSLRPLGQQQVHGEDGVLGSLRHPSGMGLASSYADLIRAAFQERWWNSDVVVDRNLNAIRRGTPSGLNEFSVMEANFSLFWGLAIQLYGSTQITGDSPFDRFAKGNSSALSSLQKQGLNVFTGEGECTKCHSGPVFTEVADGTGGDAFVRTGVRPVADDAGRGDGRFKTSTIRNTELTGPYFHNGGYGTLRQVVDFYDRGGDFPGELDQLGLSESDKVALVAFMLSTTDDRARFQKAPFDHPSLAVPNGPSVPAVGRNGVPAGMETRTFLGLDPFDDGEGAAAIVVAQQSSKIAAAGAPELVLLSYANRGQPYWLFASVGSPLELPAAGLPCPTRADLELLLAKPGLALVSQGVLDGIGVAQVKTPAVPAAARERIEYFFAVLDPATHEIVAVSSAISVAPVL